MRWIEARKPNLCSNCQGDINIGDIYFGASYVAYCKDCGTKYIKGELVTINRHKLQELKKELDDIDGS